MESRCCVLGCLSTCDDGVRLHEFPFDNQLLLPVWIMATHRSDWTPVVKSRICDRHFNIDDYEGGNKNSELKPNACPMLNTPNNIIEVGKTIVPNKSICEISSTSDVNFSDIDSDDLPDTPNTSDMKFSDDDSISSDSNSNDAAGLDDDCLSSLSEYDTVSLSSTTSFTSIENANKFINQKCAVVLCNEKARKQFDRLFFIDFPKDNIALCNTWWKICGHSDKFNPLLKICSIHFDTDAFATVTVRRDGQLYRQTILKNSIVPTLYLLPHEYTKFTRKRKKTNNDSKKTGVQKKSSEIGKCAMQCCEKTFSKDGASTLFFRFPLENKFMLEKWVNNIGLPNWQPLETDVICSDHFENHYIMNTKDGYKMNKNAVPSIKPKNPLVINSENYHITNSIKSHSCEYDFSSLKLHRLDENILKIKEKKRRQIKNENNVLINSLDSIEGQKQENFEKITLSKSVDRNANKQKPLLKLPTKCNESNSEYVFMDILGDVKNTEELQSEYNNSSANATKKYLESFVREIAKDECNKTEWASNGNNLKSRPAGVSDVTNMNSIISTKCTSEVTKKSQMEFTAENILEGTNIPKSKNSGNDCDYVYLDMLSGNDVEEFLSFEKKSTSKNCKQKIMELLGTSHTKGTPESIIYNKNLTECYGEMLPPYCNSDCQLMCYYTIPGPQRREIYKEFQMLHSVTAQNCEITQLVQLRMIKKGDGTFESSPTYRLLVNKKLVVVCRLFFMNTLGIPEHRLNAVLKPINYSWYSDRDTAMKVNQPEHLKVIDEPIFMTDFMKESQILLDKDYNAYEPESDTEVSLENVSIEEYEKVFLYMKGIPRVLSSYQMPGQFNKQFFETSICWEHMYQIYSENYIRNKISPPCTKRQFKKIYNQYMKTFLKMV